MLFYYIRHADPIYHPDSLTPLGERQAEALAKRLAVHGLDKIYCSPSNRAQLTAKPTCEVLKKTAEIVEFVNEDNAWNRFTIERTDGKPGRLWLFQNLQTMETFTSREIRELGDRWFEHPDFAGGNYGQSVEWIYDNVDAFFKQLGYEHERYTGKFKVINPNKDRVALFAHQGMGIAFLSALLDIPYPQFASHFDITHTGVTVVEFEDRGGYAIPRILTHSNDSHIFHDGLPLRYNNGWKF